MPVPKRKRSKAKVRSHKAVQAISAANVIACPNCDEPAMPHRMCPHCGQYAGRVVKEVEED